MNHQVRRVLQFVSTVARCHPTLGRLMPRGLAPTVPADVPKASCPICDIWILPFGASHNRTGMSDPVVARQMEALRRDHGIAKNWTYLCERCGLIFIRPVPDDEDFLKVIFNSIGKSRPIPGWSSMPTERQDPHLLDYHIRVPSLQDTIDKHLTGSLTVLDVGAHGGSISTNLAWLPGSSVDLLAVEGSECRHTHVASQGEKAEYRMFTGLLDDLPQSAANYDLIMALHVFEHTAKPRAFLSRCRELLAPNGIMILEFPYGMAEAYGNAVDETFSATHHNFFTLSSACAISEMCGFEVIESLHLRTFFDGYYLSWDPHEVLRLVLRKGEPRAPARPLGADTINALLGSVAGTIAYEANEAFWLCQSRPTQALMVNLFAKAPGYLGVKEISDVRAIPDGNWIVALDRDARRGLRRFRSGLRVI